VPGSRSVTNAVGAVSRRIALVEDDADIAYTIRLNLRKHGWHVDHFVSGLRALEALEEKPYDLVILDLNLPDVDGLAVARELRQHDDTKRISILMLTARVEERDKLLGFDVGADDYLTKPFSMKELVARVSAQLRRAGGSDASEEDVYETEGLRIDRPRFEVIVEGHPVRLTKKEFDLLWYLVRNRARVVTRDTILARLWGYDADVETRTVDVHIRSLRRKLGDRWIDTVVGVGYRFVEPSREE
jgi:two-component system, OmpR family, alkaline phosphatase synthesis response regulator PhoP